MHQRKTQPTMSVFKQENSTNNKTKKEPSPESIRLFYPDAEVRPTDELYTKWLKKSRIDRAIGIWHICNQEKFLEERKDKKKLRETFKNDDEFTYIVALLEKSQHALSAFRELMRDIEIRTRRVLADPTSEQNRQQMEHEMKVAAGWRGY